MPWVYSLIALHLLFMPEPGESMDLANANVRHQQRRNHILLSSTNFLILSGY
jgi:hypothetical protein